MTSRTPTIQDVFWLWLELPRDRRQRLRRIAWQALVLICLCGTPAMGCREYVCEVHGKIVIPNTCRRRDCPCCVGGRAWDWCEQVEARLLSCPYFHVVFTLPGDLHACWRHNRRLMADLLFDEASATLRDLLADPQYMGGAPAMLGVLHTHGGGLWLHPHVHFVVSSAGLSPDRALVFAKRLETLLPFAVLRTEFKTRFLAAFKRLAQQPDFYIPKGQTALHLRNLVDKLYQRPWRNWNVMVFLREDVRPVIRYLSRSVYGGPIRNDRLVSVGPDGVTFRYRNWRDAEEGGDKPPPLQLRTVPLNEFVALWSEHVPERGFKTVRYWGLFAPGAKPRLDLARAALGQQPTPEQPRPGHSDQPAEPVVRCPHCGAVMVERIPSGRIFVVREPTSADSPIRAGPPPRRLSFA